MGEDGGKEGVPPEQGSRNTRHFTSPPPRSSRVSGVWDLGTKKDLLRFVCGDYLCQLAAKRPPIEARIFDEDFFVLHRIVLPLSTRISSFYRTSPFHLKAASPRDGRSNPRTILRREHVEIRVSRDVRMHPSASTKVIRWASGPSGDIV